MRAEAYVNARGNCKFLQDTIAFAAIDSLRW